ncbi:MAG: outer membrane beta-barrel protein [Gemmataceae bacterium]|nr:outer membrane beta-barrel protein [Gemmataceae bacterium]
MLDYLLLGAALMVGQAETGPPAPGPAESGPVARAVLLPPADPDEALAPVAVVGPPTEKAPEGATIIVAAPLLPSARAPEPAPPPPAPAPPPVRWDLMKVLQGTWLGYGLDGHRMYVYGWVDQSFTASTAAENNSPVVWNDRANEYLMQQAWVRFGRAVVTSGTTLPTVGFQADFLYGTDYRMTLPRGLWNSQLLNADGDQNLYGVDAIQHYVNVFVPTLFQGTEFRVGRLWTPWGVESLESVSTPLVSRSYAFNWCPPFTHCGVGAYITFNPEWSAVLMAVNGNDVYFGDPAAEWRFVGNVKWTQPGGGRNTVTLATSVGRGKFNAADPFAPATVGLMSEGAGRNNINVFDVVWTHLFNSVLSYNLEAIFGYQTNVPGIANADGYGTATWASLVHYLFYSVSPHATAILRLETFDDFQGQRTGFEGLYVAATAGMQFRCRNNSIIVRPEVRYDYNFESTPFEGNHGLFTAAASLVYRW